MKCPYRKVTTYTRLAINKRVNEATLQVNKSYGPTPCKVDEADTVKEEFAECLTDECPLYKRGYVNGRLLTCCSKAEKESHYEMPQMPM